MDAFHPKSPDGSPPRSSVTPGPVGGASSQPEEGPPVGGGGMGASGPRPLPQPHPLPGRMPLGGRSTSPPPTPPSQGFHKLAGRSKSLGKILAKGDFKPSEASEQGPRMPHLPRHPLNEPAGRIEARRLMVIVGVVLLVAITGVGALVGPSYYQRFQTRQTRINAIEKIRESLTRKDFSQAIAISGEFLKANPGDFRLPAELNTILLTSLDELSDDQAREAIVVLNEALKYHPQQVPWRETVRKLAVKTRDFEQAATQAFRLATTPRVDVKFIEDALDDLAKLGDSPFCRYQRFAIAEAAVKNTLNNPTITRRAVKAALDVGQFETASKLFEGIHKGSDNDAELLYFQGVLASSQRRLERSLELLNAAIAKDPGLLDAHAARLAVLASDPTTRGQIDEAVSAMLAANPGQARAHLIAHQIYRGINPDRAQIEIERAGELEPLHPEVVLTRAREAIKANQIASAIALIQQGWNVQPMDDRLPVLLASLYVSEGKPELAIDVLERAMKSLSFSIPIRESLADTYLVANRLDDLDKFLAAWPKSDNPLNESAKDYMKALALAARSRPSDALQILDPLITRLSDEPERRIRALLLAARCHAELGRLDDRIRALSQAVASLNEPLRNLVERDRGQNQVNDTFANMIRSAALEAAALSLNRATIQDELARDWVQIDRAISEAIRLNPGDPAAELMRVQAMLLRGQVEQADQLLASLRGRYPQNPVVWSSSAVLTHRRGDPAGGRDLVRLARQTILDPVESLRAQIDAYALMGDKESLAALKRLVGEVSGLPPESRRPLASRVLQILLASEGADAASEALEQLAQADPDNPELMRFDLELAMARRDEEALSRLRDQFRRVQGPDSREASLADAARLMLRHIQAVNRSQTGPTPLAENSAPPPADAASSPELTQARAILEKLARSQPDWYTVWLFLGDLAVLERKSDEAIAHGRKALELAPDNLRASRFLANQYALAGRWKDLDELIAQLETKIRLTDDLRAMAAEVAIRRGNLQRAQDMSKALDDTSLAGLVTKARIEQASGQAINAIVTYRKALTLYRTLPPEQRAAQAEIASEIYPLLVEQLRVTNAAPEARALMRQIERDLPDPVLREFTLARCHHVLEEYDQAQALYDKVLAQRPEFGRALICRAILGANRRQLDQAEADLRRTLAIANLPAAIQIEARRKLAELILIGPSSDPAKLAEALKLIEANSLILGETLEDKRLRSIGLIRLPDQVPAAITLLEEIARLEPLKPIERFLLALAYEARCDWPKARPMFTQWLNDRDAVPAQLEIAARVFLDRKDRELASIALSRLTEPQPGMSSETPPAPSPRIKALQARLAHLKGDARTATTQLDQLEKTRALPDLELAALWESINQPERAETLLRRAAQARDATGPLARGQLAGFLARRGRAAEALERLKAGLGEFPNPVITDLVGQILDPRSGANEAILSELESIVEARIKQDERNNLADFGLALALIRDTRGHHAEAAATYRQVLAIQPDNFVVLNNLAFLQALGADAEGTLAEARRNIDRAMNFTRRVGDLMDTRGLVLLKQGEADSAIQTLLKVVGDRDDPVALFHLARACEVANRLEESRNWLNEAEAKGLKPELLHPLERPDLKQLRDRLQASLANR